MLRAARKWRRNCVRMAVRIWFVAAIGVCPWCGGSMQKAAGAVSSEQTQAQMSKRGASAADSLGKAQLKEASRDRQRDSGWSKRDSGGLGKRDSLVAPPTSPSSLLHTSSLLLPLPPPCYTPLRSVPDCSGRLECTRTIRCWSKAALEPPFMRQACNAGLTCVGVHATGAVWLLGQSGDGVTEDHEGGGKARLTASLTKQECRRRRHPP